MNIYELTDAYLRIQEMIENGDEGLEDTLESIDAAIEDKALNYAKVIKNLEALTKGIEEEEKRLSNKRKSINNNINRMKSALQDNMQQMNVDNIKTDLFSFNIQKNPPSVKIVNEELLPKRFYVDQAPKLDKKSLLKELKESEVPGAEITQGKSLRIR